jgi:O-antigen ligase
MVLATGSRTAAMATVVGVAVFFRSEIGKFILLAVVLALGFVLLSVTVESSARLTFDRFSEGQDTRGAVWSEALAIFYASPIFGEFPFLQPGQEPNGIESTFIRTLANMGLVGATVLAVPLLFIFRDLLRVIQLSRSSPEYRRLCDFYLSSCASLLVLNIFDGYAFGFMTLPVMFMYLVLSVGSLIVDQPDGTETDIAAEES